MQLLQFDDEKIAKGNIGGWGGKEKDIVNFFDESLCIERINHSIYDFIINKNILVEVKKQQGLNWFDISKYHNLSKTENEIVMLFLLHKAGVINCVFGVKLEDFLDLACNDTDFMKDGWTKESIHDAHQTKLKYPKIEYKAPLNVTKFFNTYKDGSKVCVYYQRVSS